MGEQPATTADLTQRAQDDSAASPRPLLLVEDEPHGRDVLAGYLDHCGFSVSVAPTCKDALRLTGSHRFVLILLDLTLPDGDGLEFLRELRQSGSNIPVIVISARGSEEERITGLLTGADDYLPKPASPREVVARVVTVLRRAGQPPAEQLVYGPLKIDPTNRMATLDGVDLDLAPKELELLILMAQNPNKAFTRAELLSQAWGSRPDWQDPGTVTVHIRRLRKKIEADPANPIHLQTVYGHGYRFVP